MLPVDVDVPEVERHDLGRAKPARVSRLDERGVAQPERRVSADGVHRLLDLGEGGCLGKPSGPCAAPARRRARVTASAWRTSDLTAASLRAIVAGARPPARTSQLCGVRREAADVDVLEIEPLVLQPGSEIAQVGPVCAPRRLGQAGLARKRSIAAAVSTSTVSRPRPDACPMRLAFGACKGDRVPLYRVVRVVVAPVLRAVWRLRADGGELPWACDRRREPRLAVGSRSSSAQRSTDHCASWRRASSGRTGSWGACSTPSAPSRSNAGVGTSRRSRPPRVRSTRATLAMFPRGTVLGDADRPWRRGAARLALTTGAPLVPVAIVGAADALRPGTKLHVSRVSASGSASPIHVEPVTPTIPIPAGADGARSRRRRRVVQGVARACAGRTLGHTHGRARTPVGGLHEQRSRPGARRTAVRRANFRRIVGCSAHAKPASASFAG